MKVLTLPLCLLVCSCIGNEIVPAIQLDQGIVTDVVDASPRVELGSPDQQVASDSDLYLSPPDLDASAPKSCLPVDDPIDWPSLYQQAIAAGGTEHRVSTEEQMQAALDLVEPGDVILVEDGDYSGWNLSFTRSGTEQAPVVVTAESKAKGRLGAVTFRKAGTFGHFVEANWNIVGGFTFDDVYETVFYLYKTDSFADANTNNRFTDNVIKSSGHERGTAAALIEIFGRNKRNRIDHNIFDNNYSIGVRIRWESGDRDLGPSKETRIDHNDFRQPATVGYDDQWTYGAMPFQTCCSSFREDDPQPTYIFEHNTIMHRRPSSKISNSIISNSAGGGVVRYNRIVSDGAVLGVSGHGNSVYGNVLEGVSIGIHGSNHLVLGNIIDSADEVGWGISLWRWGRRQPDSCQTRPDTHDITIAHNTIIGALTAGLKLGFCDYGACRPIHGTNVIANNLISMGQGTLIDYNTSDEPGRTTVCADDGTHDADGGKNSGFVFSSNLYHAHGDASLGSGHDLDASPIDAAQCVLEEIEPGSPAARLSPGCSAALDAAMSVSGVPELAADFEGQARGCDGAADVGADELGCGCAPAP